MMPVGEEEAVLMGYGLVEQFSFHLSAAIKHQQNTD